LIAENPSATSFTHYSLSTRASSFRANDVIPESFPAAQAFHRPPRAAIHTRIFNASGAIDLIVRAHSPTN
jgi:hypothetical protein